MVQDATAAAKRVQDDLYRLSGVLERTRSELQDATKTWRACRVEHAERRGWVRAHTRVALPHAASEEHVRLNALLSEDGPMELYKRAAENPSALSASLGLERLQVEVTSGVLRIQDVMTAETVVWEPPRRSGGRPSTDPSEVQEQDALTQRLQGGGGDD